MCRVLLLLTAFFLCLSNAQAEERMLPYGSGIPVLLYHGLLKEPDPSKIYSMSVEAFRDHLGALKIAGYTTVSLQDLLDYYRHKKQLPAKSVMITFDDGERSSFENADPILKEMGFRAAMFIIPLMQEKKYPLYLSWEELNAMHRSGRWDIGAHGYRYHNLIALDSEETKGNFASNLQWLKDKNRLETVEEFENRLSEDLILQKKTIESHIPGLEVIAFAYPFGDIGYSAENIDAALAQAINYMAVSKVFSLSFGTVTFDTEDYTVTTTPQLIVRLMDSERISPQALIRVLQKAYLYR